MQNLPDDTDDLGRLLRQSPDNIRACFDQALVAIGITSAEGRFLRANPALSDLLGYAEIELLRMSWPEIVLTSDREAELARLEALRSTGSHTEVVGNSCQAKNGAIVRTRTAILALKDDSGRTVRFLLLAVADGEPVSAESAAQDIRQRQGIDEAYRVLVDSSLQAMAIIHEDRMVFINQAMATLLGCERDAIVGCTAIAIGKRFVHPDDLPVLRARSQAHRDGSIPPVRYECRLVREDGRTIWTDNTIALIEYSGQRAVQILCTDITDRKKAEEDKRRVEAQLQQAMKMEAIGRLSGGIAHDFNNLLTGITGNVELALLEINADDPLRAPLMEVVKAAERAGDLTRHLLVFSRRQIIAPRRIDLNEVIDGLRRMMDRVIREDVDLQFHLERPLAMVNADPGQIEQIILNLCVNARDAMPKGGALIIESANLDLSLEECQRLGAPQPGPHVVLSIRDNGVGMSDDVKNHLFEPFFTTKPMGKGTGLGLATVFGVMQQHSGAIGIESSEGEGTTVRLYFPRCASKAEPNGPSAGVKALPTGGETILLVEDESLVRNFAATTLRRLGYRVLQAHNGDGALLQAECHLEKIHLLLTDIIMPGMNGRELSKRLVLLRPEMKVLFTSGHSEEIIARNGILEPGLHFLAKPFGPGELAQMVRRVLDEEPPV